MTLKVHVTNRGCEHQRPRLHVCVPPGLRNTLFTWSLTVTAEILSLCEQFCRERGLSRHAASMMLIESLVGRAPDEVIEVHLYMGSHSSAAAFWDGRRKLGGLRNRVGGEALARISICSRLAVALSTGTP